MKVYKRWTDEEMELLGKIAEKELTFEEVAKRLDRSMQSVRSKFAYMRYSYVAGDYALYKGDKLVAIGTVKEIAEFEGTSEESIRTSTGYVNKSKKANHRVLVKLRTRRAKMNIDKEHKKGKELIKELRQERIDAHKCSKCVWGTWTETSYKCLLPKCLKGLGNYR